MKLDKMQSLERSKKMSFKLGDLLGKEGLACCFPGGGVAYELGKILVGNMFDYYNDRTKKRIENFCNTIVGGKDHTNINDDFLNKEIKIEDFHAILSSCVKDMEDEKTEIYSTLTLSLMNSSMRFDERRHMIQSCSQLTYNEISLLRTMYISSKYDFMTVGSIEKQLEDIFTTTDPYNLIYIDSLKKFGLVDVARKKVTILGERFISSVYKENSLIPEAIGKSQCRKGFALVISYQLADISHHMIYSSISGILYKNKIASNIHSIDDRHVNSGIHTHYKFAFLLQSKDRIEMHYMKSISELSKKMPIVKVQIENEDYGCDFSSVEFCNEILIHRNKGNLNFSGLDDQIDKIIRKYF